MNSKEQPIQEQQSPRSVVDLAPAQEVLIKLITQADVAKLQEMERSGIARPCASRDYIAGEAAPLEDRGAIRTFVTFHGIGILVRTFITITGIIGHSLDTYLDTTLPGVQEVVVESKAKFDPFEHARFVQATLNQKELLRPTSLLRPPKKH